MRFLIDANLPYRFELWRGPAFTHVFDLDDTWSDTRIWNHARENSLVIVSKDADFSDRIILAEPPPRVIHIRAGNMKMREFHAFVYRVWPQAAALIENHKLVIIHTHTIECVA
jgi:predicted nuclease of predicted toxin-antitoxin system